MVVVGDVESTDDPAAALRIERELLASLSRINRQSTNRRRSFVVEDRDGGLAAGLSCSTAYGWLHVETLWVANAVRLQGHGRALMEAAEAFALDLGCHGVWLDTSSADARAFYRKLGYTVFGELANGRREFPPEHRRWFLQRTLQAA